ncbi:unnamed protein product [Urochloa humidicola]
MPTGTPRRRSCSRRRLGSGSSFVGGERSGTPPEKPLNASARSRSPGPCMRCGHPLLAAGQQFNASNSALRAPAIPSVAFSGRDSVAAGSLATPRIPPKVPEFFLS